MKRLLLGILIFFLFCPPASARETITWLILDWPPWMMLTGEDAGQGRFNHILRILQENLPEYEHRTENMNWARFWHELEDNKNNYCNIFAYKSGKREEIAYFSTPLTIGLPNAIIMKKSTKEKLGNPEKYSIVTLLHDKRFSGAIEKTRSYTGKIDDILKDVEPGSNLTRIPEGSQSMIKMVITGRIDYTIEYPVVASYHAGKHGADPDAIVSIPITEMDPITYAYLACTRNEWGKRVIDQVNAALCRVKPTEEFRRIVEIGHTDPEELEIIRGSYETFLDAQ